jgi:hypothetical protein
MHWTGVELEQRFVDLGNQNLDQWRNRYAPHFPGYGTARLVQGDSRRLVNVVTGAGGVVSSPPFEGVLQNSVERSGLESFGKPSHVSKQNHDYGQTPGNLGNMPAGVVSSPPFGHTNQSTDEEFLQRRAAERRNGSRTQPGLGTYGQTPGNIGNDSPATFWSAAAVIVAQCYEILRPGGYAAWVTGDFVRNRQRVPFGEQWLALCESVGFEPVLWAVAWKSEHNGTQHDIFGEAQGLRKTKVSFFRRLANQKRPETAIENEDVIFVRKPA